MHLTVLHELSYFRQWTMFFESAFCKKWFIEWIGKMINENYVLISFFIGNKQEAWTSRRSNKRHAEVLIKEGAIPRLLNGCASTWGTFQSVCTGGWTSLSYTVRFQRSSIIFQPLVPTCFNLLLLKLLNWRIIISLVLYPIYIFISILVPRVKELSEMLWLTIKALTYGHHQLVLQEELVTRLMDERHAALNWIKSYLSNRSYQVQTDGALSEEASCLRGVPRAVIGPLLFFCYI